VIRTENLTMRFGDQLAVDRLVLDVRPGEIYGFLGPNGAGKTTTIHMILNLQQPTAGTVVILGETLAPGSFAFRQRIGVVAEEPAELSRLTGWELVRYFAHLCAVDRPEPRMDELFHTLDLWDFKDAAARGYSRGMRQKLSLIRALVHEPDLLSLDEPVSGLDPHGIRQVRETIDAYRNTGGTVFISSHILSEIERSADRVGILHDGRLLIEDTLDGIRRRLGQGRRFVVELDRVPPSLEAALRGEPLVLDVTAPPGGQEMHMILDDAGDGRAAVSSIITASGATILGMRSEQMSLEEAFVTITTQNVTRLAGTPA
jgi:ABC-2 type transport system ATP-binding protein